MSQKISMRSLLARVVISTRYTICGADPVKDFTRRTTIAFSYIFKSLPDSFVRIGPKSDRYRALVASTSHERVRTLGFIPISYISWNPTGSRVVVSGWNVFGHIHKKASFPYCYSLYYL